MFCAMQQPEKKAKVNAKNIVKAKAVANAWYQERAGAKAVAKAKNIAKAKAKANAGTMLAKVWRKAKMQQSPGKQTRQGQCQGQGCS